MAHAQAFKLGQIVKLPSGEVGQVLQEDFHRGQWRYYVHVPGRDVPVWEWEGHLRSEHGEIYGR